MKFTQIETNNRSKEHRKTIAFLNYQIEKYVNLYMNTK